MNNQDLTQYSLKAKVLLPIGLMLVALMLVSVVGAILGSITGNMNTPTFYTWFAVLQNVVVFVLPAVLASWMITRRPWQALRCDVAPSWRGVAVAVLMYAVSIPAMNWLVDWNNSLALPESLRGLEEVMREAENQAQAVTDAMIQGNSLLGMLAMVLVVGVLTGVGEEFFFRGALLGALLDHPVRRHVAVWVVAILFSAMHFQFYGFVPRMLMGAWLGYLLLWSKSIWVPVIYHAINNGMVVVVTWLEEHQLFNVKAFEHVGVSSPLWAILSAVAVVGLAVATPRLLKK